MPADAPGSTAIVVMTPEAASVVGDLYRVHANAGRQGMAPHVTLLIPFVPAGLIDEAVGRRLRRVLRRFNHFEYALSRFESFDTGVLYLAPEPSRPFVDLALALIREFPDYPPYEGIHDQVIPHVTVSDSDDEELLERIRSEVEPRLPIECDATKVTLVERGTDLRWRARAAIALGSLK